MKYFFSPRLLKTSRDAGKTRKHQNIFPSNFRNRTFSCARPQQYWIELNEAGCFLRASLSANCSLLGAGCRGVLEGFLRSSRRRKPLAPRVSNDTSSRVTGLTCELFREPSWTRFPVLCLYSEYNLCPVCTFLSSPLILEKYNQK